MQPAVKVQVIYLNANYARCFAVLKSLVFTVKPERGSLVFA